MASRELALLDELELSERRIFKIKAELMELGKLSGYERLQDIIKITVDQMLEGVQIIDKNWRYVYLNKAALLHARKSPEELIGRTMPECYPGIEDTHFFKVAQHVMGTQENKRIENYFEYPDKSKCWYELTIEPHEHGLLIRSLDITDKKDIETKYFQSQKLEAMGILAGSVAHDFNNKLGVMQIFCELALKGIDQNLDREILKGYINDVYSAVKQSTYFTKQLLAFSRKQVVQLEPLNVNTVLTKLKPTLQALFSSKVNLKFGLSENIGFVNADATQLDQVFLNLCVNARDAMPNGGNLLIKTYQKFLDADFTAKEKALAPGSHIVISIEDDGVGISPDNLGKIFDPFFTTKPNGVGTGLGLATAHGIIHQFQGAITAISQHPKGTTFLIYLPELISEKADQTKEMIRSTPNRCATHILIVEPDELYRKALHSIFIGSEIKPTIARDLQEAKNIWLQSDIDFPLIITSAIKFDDPTTDFLELLSNENCRSKILFMSATKAEQKIIESKFPNRFGFLQKPISATELKTAIDDELKTSTSISEPG